MPWVCVEHLIEPLPKKQVEEVKRILKLKKTHARFLADEDFPADATALMRDLVSAAQTPSSRGEEARASWGA